MPSDEKYIHCWRCDCDVTRLAVVVAILSVIGSVASIQQLLSARLPRDFKTTAIITDVFFCISAALAAVGALKRNPYLLLPYIILLFIACISLCIIIAYAALKSFTEKDKDQSTKWNLIAGAFSFALVFCILFMNIARQCYNYLSRWWRNERTIDERQNQNEAALDECQ
ncbi:hypothetical protein QR680_015570 [Steinernema hermaphroditum]|uniref:Uncharacterized protein n=1 Tax=Steinernema hermaphroditum TaxID=289476 RepID=A0AA39HAF6_9BILA|nr:hypothetical protein QR680_015570 [Steinernema hermaphroditum]